MSEEMLPLHAEKKTGGVRSLFADLPRALRTFLAPYIACFLLVGMVLMDVHDVPNGFAPYPALVLLLALYLLLAALFSTREIRASWRIGAYIGSKRRHRGNSDGTKQYLEFRFSLKNCREAHDCLGD